MDDKLLQIVENLKNSSGKITFLTGAGISAESSIPTFRGPEGFWTIGSENYHPQQMASRRMFSREPDEVWAWYLYRMGICRQASPNPGHLALVQLEEIFQDRFTLITQNVDNLHLVAGNSPDRTYQIHGNIFQMRCANECNTDVYPAPSHLATCDKKKRLTRREVKHLRCQNCGGPARPHVLWFDEFYNENNFRAESSMQAAVETDLLVVVGTSGATNLPHMIAQEVVRRAKPIVDINIEKNPFSKMARGSGGLCLREAGTSGMKRLLGVVKNIFRTDGRSHGM